MKFVQKRWKFGGARRRAKMFKSLCTELIMHESIETHFRRAQMTSRLADKLITLAKDRSLSARRRISHLVHTEKAAKKLFWHLWKRYESRYGGYTRVFQTGRRGRDGTKMAVVEFVDSPASILTTRQEIKRAENKARIKSYKRGLGSLAHITEPAPLPGFQPERVIFRSLGRSDTTESTSAETSSAEASS
uniref:50S ribosomal protein L17 n=1 Tax=Rhodosorus marinus TaxID=101924 RepID=A0A7S2ZW60_9RHOD|mmetsp:Transcript_33902/g.133069  ORF Transcript_33902/g.133069 Transcript_33902/m.133069 type:complete len:190 (+) Transcript_33902:622-1191(+)